MSQATGNAPGVYLVIKNPKSDKDNMKKRFPLTAVRVLSILQISLGVISIISQIIILASMSPERRWMNWTSGEGIYSGVFYIIAGCLGLLASFKTNACNISAHMVLSIIASIFGLSLLIFSSIHLSDWGSPYLRTSQYYKFSDSFIDMNIGLYSIQLICALTEGVIAILCSALCCRACCCRGGGGSDSVVYLPHGLVDPARLQGIYDPVANAENPGMQLSLNLGMPPQPVTMANATLDSTYIQKLEGSTPVSKTDNDGQWEPEVTDIPTNNMDDVEGHTGYRRF